MLKATDIFTMKDALEMVSELIADERKRPTKDQTLTTGQLIALVKVFNFACEQFEALSQTEELTI